MNLNKNSRHQKKLENYLPHEKNWELHVSKKGKENNLSKIRFKPKQSKYSSWRTLLFTLEQVKKSRTRFKSKEKSTTEKEKDTYHHTKLSPTNRRPHKPSPTKTVTRNCHSRNYHYNNHHHYRHPKKPQLRCPEENHIVMVTPYLEGELKHKDVFLMTGKQVVVIKHGRFMILK